MLQQWHLKFSLKQKQISHAIVHITPVSIFNSPLCPFPVFLASFTAFVLIIIYLLSLIFLTAYNLFICSQLIDVMSSLIRFLSLLFLPIVITHLDFSVFLQFVFCLLVLTHLRPNFIKLRESLALQQTSLFTY